MEVIRQHFEQMGSTNTWAKLHAHQLPRDKITLVTAGMQTAGRGRFNRKWESPAHENIYASFCFFIEKHRTDIGNIPQVLALSAAEILKALGFSPELKWPNDVLLSKKKVAGILAETTPLSDQLCMIIGIGLNVNMPLETLQKIDRPATSLANESGRPFDVEKVLDRLQIQFTKDLDLFFEEGFHPFFAPYCASMSQSLNQVIQFHDNRTVWKGFFDGINHDGSLRLKLPEGEIKTFVAGEILWPQKI
ncbi:MAG: biotin--[acetyl-CoA-carboxylase] ligase [Parachlamydiaceae bacterium]